MSKEKPAVNAIMRGVYTKDKPLDLDKGKYENRLTLLKVPRLTKERVLRVSPDMVFLEGEVSFTGSIVKQEIEISKERTFFNRINLGIIITNNDVEFWLKVRISEKDDVYITIKNFTLSAGSTTLAYDLPAQTFFKLEYQLSNINAKLDMTYLFYFSDPIKEAIDNIELQQIAINGNITNLQAIITDIANIETQNISMDGNITNLQAIISDIANIETQQISINSDLTNLQAIITDIANIETQNITIAGDTSNLQAIISDIANIETQLISIQATNATINTNIGTINTAIANIETTNATIDIDIGTVKDLDIDISEVRNKTKQYSGTISTGTTLIGTINSDYIYNGLKIQFKPQDTNPMYFQVWLKDTNNDTIFQIDIDENEGLYLDEYYFIPSKYVKIYLTNSSASTTDIDYIVNFFYSESPKVNEVRLKGQITASGSGATSNLSMAVREKQLYNRLTFTGYNATQAQNYYIRIYQRFPSATGELSKLMKEVNITASAGEMCNTTVDFTATDNFYVWFVNNGAYTCYITANVFFSKNLKPELDEHIDDSTIHFLEGAINLANINEKSHTNLTDKGVNTHPTIDTHLADGTKHFLEGAINLANINEKSYNSLTNKPSNFMLGSANAEYIPCIFIYDSVGAASTRWQFGANYGIENTGTADMYLIFQIPKPTNRDGKKLYIKGFRIGLADADANDYVYSVILAGFTTTRTSIENNNNGGANFKTIAETAITYGSPHDVSSYKKATLAANCSNTTSGELEVSYIEALCYYDT